MAVSFASLQHCRSSGLLSSRDMVLLMAISLRRQRRAQPGTGALKLTEGKDMVSVLQHCGDWWEAAHLAPLPQQLFPHRGVPC